jgi:predicted dehydrogenase
MLHTIVLGYNFQSAPKTLLASRRKFTKLVTPNGDVTNDKYPVTADDTIFLHGTLSSDIPLSFSLRGGKPFKGTPGLDWRIYGEKGEIRITASGPFLQVGYPDMKIQVYDFEEDRVEDVVVEKDEFDKNFAGPVGNVARVYRALVRGENNCSFEDAVERHELIDEMYKENGTLI